MTTRERLIQMIETAKAYLPSYGPSGEPWKRCTKYVNDHHVQVNIFGWDERVVFWLDKSSEPLSLNDVLDRI